TVNFIQNHGLKRKQFRTFLVELDNEYDELSYHTELRWFSRAKAVDRFFHLREEIRLFMDKVGHSVPELDDNNWTKDLDIINHLNTLNTILQGKHKTVVDLFDTIRSFKMKLNFWITRLESDNTDHFPKLRFLSTSDSNHECYVSILRSLYEEFFEDLASLETDFSIISLPFLVDLETVHADLQLKFIDLRCDRALKLYFEQTRNILEFYKVLPQEKYPRLHRSAARILAMFGSTYSCEQLFSVFKTNKFSEQKFLR
ncbi:General transcription factor II-I repeat domain-containing protein 2B, partial [Habropoda laboriosa]